MLFTFGKKRDTLDESLENNESIEAKNKSSNYSKNAGHMPISIESCRTNTEDNDMMSRDLMILIGKAMTEWAKMYHMENLPKRILFKQVLSILNAIDIVSFFKD